MKKTLLPPGTNRIQLDLATVGLAEIPCFGVYDLAHSDKGLFEHRHAGAMEICYVVRGEQVYRVAGHDYPLRGNDVFVTFPGERHGSGGHPFGKGLLYWLQVCLPAARRPLLGLASADAAPLIRALRTLPRRMFRGRPELQTLFEQAARLAQANPTPLGRLRLANVLQQWLLLVVDCAGASPETGHTADIRRVLAHLDTHLDEPCPVPHMARVAGLSTPRFKAKFKRQLGIPPREYHMRCRIAQATIWLREGRKSVTEVALDLGFPSSQYFATVFKRFTNRRPREVRGQRSADSRTERPGDRPHRRRA